MHTTAEKANYRSRKRKQGNEGKKSHGPQKEKQNLTRLPTGGSVPRRDRVYESDASILVEGPGIPPMVA